MSKTNTPIFFFFFGGGGGSINTENILSHGTAMGLPEIA